MSVVLRAIPTALGENANSSDTSICINGWKFALTDPAWRCNDRKMFDTYDSNDKRYVFQCPSQTLAGKVTAFYIRSIIQHIPSSCGQ